MAKRRFEQRTNRVDYGELLQEDVDYVLDEAVGMTYSLDMEALMGIPLCLGMGGEMTSGQRNNPLYVLEAIRRIGSKLSIFCNVGGIKVPAKTSRLFALLENSIHEVRMPQPNYNFHPKLWILQYHNTFDGRIRIKVVTMSRNLTFDQSMDLAVDMAGFVGEKVHSKNQPLVDMLRFVSQFGDKKFSKLMDNVARVEEFALENSFEDYEFHSLGIYGRGQNGIKKISQGGDKNNLQQMLGNCQNLLVVSPFLSEGEVDNLFHHWSPKLSRGCLITRESSVTPKIFQRLQTADDESGIWVVNPVFCSNEAFGDEDAYGVASRDIHAKVYYTEQPNEPHKLYIGSLNASHNAFCNNVEFLLELSYGKSYVSFDSMQEDFVPLQDSPFVSLTAPNEQATTQEAEQVDFRQELYSIERGEVIEQAGKFEIRLMGQQDFPQVTIRPFFVKEKVQPLTAEVKFEDIELNCLSNLFVLAKGGSECLIRLELSGMPSQEREEAIYNDIISNKARFLTYLRYLLDEDLAVSSYEEAEITVPGQNGVDATSGMTVEQDIYEKMLQATANHPERFEAMYEVVAKLSDEKIGEELRQLIDLFCQAVGRKGKRGR